MNMSDQNDLTWYERKRREVLEQKIEASQAKAGKTFRRSRKHVREAARAQKRLDSLERKGKA